MSVSGLKGHEGRDGLKLNSGRWLNPWQPGQLRAVKLRYKTKAWSRTCKAHMAQHTASLRPLRPLNTISRGKRVSVSKDKSKPKVKCLDCSRMVWQPFIRCRPHHFAHLDAVRRASLNEIDQGFEYAIS